jgi:spore coat polysaccharide biosynthesis protein SpsF
VRIVASIQVRMGSERLPGKVMRSIAGKPMVGYLVGRLQHCDALDDVGVATGLSESNNVIQEFCEAEKIPCFRGPDEDVLGRLLGSLQDLQADIGVVVYGDNPLVDPKIVDEMILLFKENQGYDWVGNDLKTTFPAGMEVEVFTVSALADSARRACDKKIREHGTLFMRKSPSRYKLLNVEASGIRRRPNVCLGIDTPVDAAVVEEIVQSFGGDDQFSLEEILSFLDKNPEITKKNEDIPRRWRPYRGE